MIAGLRPSLRLMKTLHGAAEDIPSMRRSVSFCADSPMYRHGVCYFGDSFGWLYGVDRGCYVCPRCAGKPVEPNGTEYRLYTAQLTVPYIGSALIGRPALTHTVRKMLSAYRKTGQLQSQGTSRIVGYDFGLLLYAAAVSGVNADDLLTASLEVRDEAGMWAEYYDMSGGPIPSGMRCRPRESAVNMDGILNYLYSRSCGSVSDPRSYNETKI